MRALWLIVLFASGLLGSSCGQASPVMPSSDPLFKSDAGGGQGQFAIAMTRNLYVGMDFTEVLGAAQISPLALVQQVYLSHQNLIESLPGERMTRIAAEIAAAQPDVIGLQEVFQVYQNGVLQYDYLQILLDELAALRARYDVAVVNVALDITVPALPPTGELYQVRVVDRQAVLVRRGVPYENAHVELYPAYFAIDLGLGPPVPWRRGVTAVDVRIRGRTLRVLNTHLETQQVTTINVAQGNHLITVAGESPFPVVVVGDFNSAANPSAPEGQKTATYGNILASGLLDSWLAAGGGIEDGMTCCHDHDLQNDPSVFDQRLDLVFFTGLRGADHVEVVGDEAGDQTASGLWPSDHAGVVARLRLP
jgi:endonuclease/exonuclease/phosphatase family metal-dependent hydrolase